MHETIIKNKSEIISNAAFLLFLEKGYEGTNLREIAAFADVKASTIYFYFSSKEDLFLSVLDDVFNKLLYSQQKLLSEHDATKKDFNLLEEIFFERIKMIHKDCAAYFFLLRYRLFPVVEIATEIREKYQKWDQLEENLYAPIINMVINGEKKLEKIESKKIVKKFIKNQNSIVNDMIITGEFFEEEELVSKWEMFLKYYKL